MPETVAPAKLRPTVQIHNTREWSRAVGGNALNCLASLPCETDVLPKNMSTLASFMNLGGPDLLVILVIILVLFGAKKLPELARGLGQAIKEFQKAKDEFSDELHKAGKPDAAKPEVKQAESTVPQNPAPLATATVPDPNQNANPGKQAE